MDIDLLTKNLSEYSNEANNIAIAISKGLLPLGFVILALFFVIELLNWKNFLNRQGVNNTPISLLIEFSVKYLIGAVLLLTSGYILDAIMELSIIIINKINSIYPPSTYSLKYTDGDFGGVLMNLMMNAVGWVIEKLANVIIAVLIFIRYIDLYFLKAIAPILIGFYYSDEFRSVTMNYLKSFIAYSLLGVVLLLITIIFGVIVNSDLLNPKDGDSDLLAFLTIIKGIAYILVLVGSTRKIKSLVGVQ